MHIAKLEKKGVFLVILTNFGKDMADKLRKTHAKVHIAKLEKMVCFWSYWQILEIKKNACKNAYL